MTGSLTERYIFAVTRRVPESARADVHAELAASIADDIDARVHAGDAASHAERAVLEDLGDPDRLAAAYAGRPAFLIGPRYYFVWWRLVRLLLWIVLPIAAFGIVLGQILSGQSVGAVIGAGVGGTLTVGVHLVFWTTFVFFCIDRAEGAGAARAGEELKAWNLDSLPDPRTQGMSPGDLIATLVFLAVGVGAIIWDRFVGLAVFGTSPESSLDPQTWQPISILSHELWPWWIAALFAVMALEAVLAIVVFVRGGWTWPLAIVNAVLAAAVAIPAILLIVQGRLFSPLLLQAYPELDGEVAGILAVIAAAGIAGIALWDVIDGVLKTMRGAGAPR